MTRRFQAARERIAMWFAPRLPKLLARSGQIIQGLEIRSESASHSQQEEIAKRMEIISELQEAAALADGAPWRAGGASHSSAGRQLTEAANGIKSLSLRETIYGMAELELALEDRGWKRLIAQSNYEFSRFGIQSIMLICRLYYIKNPLARRGVDVSAFYVFGRGLEISSPDEAAHETLQAFFSDPRNASQFSHTALVKREKATYTDGNVFWAFFADPSTGELQSRGLDAIEIAEIITDPNDSNVPWFYRRDWTELQLANTNGPDNGRRESKQRTQWYCAMGYEDLANFPVKWTQIEGNPIAVDAQGQPIPVLHLKDGELPGWLFGCPRMYPAIDWLRAYRHVLEDLCTLWRALSRFAWHVETEGGAPAIAAFKQTLASTLANDLSQIETNPPPATGAAFISGPTNKITPFATGGATTMNPDNARRVLLMICSAFGLGEHMLAGDATTGSLATAASLDRPTELMFVERQEVWRETLQRIGIYVLTRSLRAPKGKLREAVAKRLGKEPSEVDPSDVLIESAPSKRKPGLEIKFREARKEGSVSNNPSSAAGPTVKADIIEASRAPKQKIIIDVKFPDILQGDIGVRMHAIVEALTLNGKEPIGIDQKIGTGLMLQELGVEDVQSVLDAMFPEGDYVADRTQQPMLPTTVRVDTADPEAQPASAAAKEAGISTDPVVIERATQLILAAARRKLRDLQRINPTRPG